MSCPDPRGWSVPLQAVQGTSRSFFLFLVSSLWLLASQFSQAIVDTNANGVSDLWEKQYNSGELFPETFDPQADPDYDGWTNAQEADAGTNPSEANPPDGYLSPDIAHIPAVYISPEEEGGEPVLSTPEAVTITWPTLAGKQYTLLYSPDLAQGSWTPLEAPFTGNGGEVTYNLALAAPDHLFWRVAITDTDTDGDHLTNFEELQIGTNPALADSDGDGLGDKEEIDVGADSWLPDTDGDGIRDGLDPAPMTGYPITADTDGDGIPDNLDTAPQISRGPAPTIAVETSLRDEVTDLQKGDVLKIPFVVSNSAGPAPGTNDLKLIVGGAEDATGSFSALGNGRFLLTWESRLSADYPTTIMRNLVIRFRDAAGATASKDLGRFDVAECAVPLAFLAVRELQNSDWNLEIFTHTGGIPKPQTELPLGAQGWDIAYRGPRVLVFKKNGAAVLTTTVPSLSYPLLRIKEGLDGAFSLKSSHDLSDTGTYPNSSYWFNNHSTATLKFTPTGMISSGGEVFATLPEPPLPPGDPMTPVTGHYLDGSEERIWFNTYWGLESKMPSLLFFHQVDIWEIPSVTESRRFALGSVELGASVSGHLKFHTAAPFGYSGLPSTTTAFAAPAQYLVGKGNWHEIAIRVGSEFTSGATACRIKLGTREAGYSSLGAPQGGWEILRRTDTGYEPFPLAGGSVDITPEHPLFQKLTSSQGLILAVKAGADIDLPHELEVELLPVHADQFQPDTILGATLIPGGIGPDWNRDCKIDAADLGKVSAPNPWRFWANDDHDSGETGGTDISLDVVEPEDVDDPPGIPGEPRDGQDSLVNGIRDLVDYFPLHFDLRALLKIYPASDYSYVLTHKSQTTFFGGAIPDPSFNVLWYPEAKLEGDPKDPDFAGSYLKNISTARLIASRKNHQIPKGGLPLPTEMLQAAKDGKGVALIEARFPTTHPLCLEVRKKEDGKTLCKMEFPVNISAVKDMLRYKFVMPGAADLAAGDIPGDPPNWPDADRNDKHFIFVHGYNVNDTQSKGWGAEIFKRFFWSGSNARFSAFAWRGYQGQIQVAGARLTADYQVNLDNAFGTAKSFKQYLDLTVGEKTVAGHSMGNILVGSAMHDWGARPKNYFMLNAAAAKECYDKTEAEDPVQDMAMVHPNWKDYPKEVRASEWHNLPSPAVWPASDARRTLTWKDRLKNVIANGGQTAVYNFYSSGEEVLNNADQNNPDISSANPFNNGELLWTKANKTWALQEKRKGLTLTGVMHSSDYGGWRFNGMDYDPVIHYEIQPGINGEHGPWRLRKPSELPNPLTNQFLLHLTETPFFDPRATLSSPSGFSTLFDPATGADSPGSQYAAAKRNTLISEMIPCTTYAAGRNPLKALGNDFDDPETPGTNINMDRSMKTDASEWPESNANEGPTVDDNGNPITNRPWLHSDIREKAFTHNWKLYEKFVELGNLKTQQ